MMAQPQGKPTVQSAKCDAESFWIEPPETLMCVIDISYRMNAHQACPPVLGLVPLASTLSAGWALAPLPCPFPLDTDLSLLQSHPVSPLRSTNKSKNLPT